ncbi:MAG: IclR family transcriptional regulator [Chloroflexi bacterium]|nr:MAG: IclR family transcriptional regulator [Chloroflexota bacterium]
MNETASYPGTQAVTRAIALLKSFNAGQPERSLAELAQATKLNKTTAYRLLAALEHERLITRTQSGGYRLGPELIALGGMALRSHDLRAAARPMLESLAEATGETTTLEVLGNRHVLVLDEVSSRYLVGISQDVGSRLPLHATSTGKLLLAYAAPEEIEAVLRGPLPRLAPCTITDPDRLRAELEQIRAQGYAVAQEELEVGFVAIAAPIRGHDQGVVAAISVGGPSLRLQGERIAGVGAQVQAAGRAISRQIGYRPD